LRYGEYAVKKLIKDLVDLGSDPKKLQAKVYGGGDVLDNISIGNLIGIKNKTYLGIRADHIKDYQQLFSRVKLNFPDVNNSYLPTDERLKNIQTLNDPQLSALCYQFGRYLLIACSRKGTQAANLQGIWNNDTNPPWDSKYTTNINTQMNYWPVESANLSECAAPLFNLVKDITDQGAQVAKEHYGSSGWVLHQNTDIWRVAAPMDGPTWGTFTVGGAWLTNELWEHYRFTKDVQYAKELYPILKGAVDFFMHFLVRHPNGKWMVTNPSTSPENFPGSINNGPYFDEVTGSIIPGTTICAGSSIDMQIITDLFNNYEQASALLLADTSYATKVAAVRVQLVPPQIGKNGSLQEWSEDWPQLEKNHRHFSHLYGLYPGNVLSAKRTPQFVDAIKAVLNQRGDDGAGFSRAWKMSLWARLYDGDRAYKIFKGYLKDQCFNQLFAKCFKPMQVDGSLGVTAGITEMLIQSHEGVIDLLPALPNEWSSGSFNGVCARGAFELNFKWNNYKLIQLNILSKTGGACKIKLPATVKIFSGDKEIAIQTEADGIINFATQKGSNYQVKFM
ncbi:MAG: glycoside hydrolase family 95-like protein, partial [Ferruginibacter sp.]